MSEPLKFPPRGFPGGYVPNVGTVGPDGKITLTKPIRRPNLKA